MTTTYDPRSFWNARFERYGHTGEVDKLLYTYDQGQRLRAIDKILSRAHITINSSTEILDVGCGTGDLIWSFRKYGGPTTTGIDVSNETIDYARRRFAGSSKVRLHTIGVEEMDLPLDSFDLVTCINVLQHITDDRKFLKAVENITKVSRMGGHILTMDFCPIKVKNKKPAPYLVIRSKEQYVSIFGKNGCRLISEFGLPRIGVRAYRGLCWIVACLRTSVSHTGRISEDMKRDTHGPTIKSRIFHLTKVTLLRLTKPLDDFLPPFPGRFTDMRILIFAKTTCLGTSGKVQYESHAGLKLRHSTQSNIFH